MNTSIIEVSAGHTVTLTRDQAIAQLVERDVTKWGDAERESSARLRSKLSHGLAVNALAHYDADRVDTELAAEARRIMTAADRKTLRKGG